MSQLQITIDTDNAAFDNGAGSECARILREFADRIEDGLGSDVVPLKDANGNRVGQAQIS